MAKRGGSDIICEKIPGGFRAFDEEGERLLTQIKNGDLVMIHVSIPRNLKLLAKWHILARVLWENQEAWPTYDVFRQKLLLQMGYCEIRLLGSGDYEMVASSLAAMNNDELSLCFEDLCQFARREYLPHLSDNAVIAHIEGLVGDRQ